MNTAPVNTALTLVGMMVLRPTGEARQTELSTLGLPSDLHAAVIVAADEGSCAGTDLPCTTVDFELTEGPDRGAVYTQLFSESALNPSFDVGAVAILARRTPNGRIVAVDDVECPFEPGATCRLLTAELITQAGAEVSYVAAPTEPATRLNVGDEAIVELFPEADPPEAVGMSPPDVATAYQFAGDFQRRSLLLWATLTAPSPVVRTFRT